MISVGRRRNGPIAEINVTPMADVMIVLLIIFMVTAPLIAHLPVQLPAAARSSTRNGDRVEILVRPGGEISVSGQPLPLTALADDLAVRAAGGTRTVLLQADRDASYSEVARVLAACRHAGIAEIALQTQTRMAQ